MGLYVKQSDKRSELQEKIAADLRAKAAASSKTADDEYVHDEHYLSGTKKTTTLAGVWVFIIFLALAVLALFIYKTNG